MPCSVSSRSVRGVGVAHSVFVEAFLPRDEQAMVDALTPGGHDAELRILAENGGSWALPSADAAAGGNGLSPEQA